MNQAQLESRITHHWTEYLPSKVEELRKQGTLAEEIQGTAKLAKQEFDRLKSLGYQDHEAEEVVLAQFVNLPPEPGADEPEWMREELAELEREYQRNPPV